jgi:hypothetical protein
MAGIDYEFDIAPSTSHSLIHRILTRISFIILCTLQMRTFGHRHGETFAMVTC